jgi:hypothetical protein
VITVRSSTLLVALFLSTAPSSASAQGLEWWDGFAPTGFEKPVSSLALLGDRVVAAGNFMTHGTSTTPVVAIYDAGQWQATAEHPPFRFADEVAVYQGQIISNGVTPSWIADGPFKWTGIQWEVLGPGLSGGYANRMDASAIYDGNLIVAGDFTFAGATVVNGIAAWDGTQWSALGDGVTGAITEILVFDGDLYVTGSFEGSGTTSFDNFARWDGVQWHAVEGTFAGSATMESGLYDGSKGWAIGRALTTHQGKLAIGGDFWRVGSTRVSNLVLFDSTLQEWSVPSGGTSGIVLSLESFDGDLVAGGTDTHMLGGSTISVAAWDGSGWAELGNSPTGTVADLLTNADRLYLAGDFAEAGGLRCGGFIVWNGTNYQTLQNPSGDGVNGRVNDLGEYQGKLLVGGDFTHGGALRLNHIGLWEDGWSEIGGGTNGPVYRTLVDGTDLYAAGDFTEAGGSPSSHLARYDGSQWHSYGTALPDGVESIALFDGDLYAGSDTYLDSIYYEGFLYRWRDGAWTAILTNQEVAALASYDGRLYMGTTRWVGSSYYSLMSSIDGTTWEPVVGTGGETGAESITRLVVINGKLLILGDSLWQWDGTDLIPYGPTEVQPVPPNQGMGIGSAVHDVLFDGTQMIMGCNGSYNGFTVLSWDGVETRWQNVGLGTWSQVRAVRMYRGELFVGGVIAMVGGQPEPSASFPTLGMASSGLARYYDPTITAVQAQSPAKIAIHGNTPNPFNPRTQLSFEIPGGGRDMQLKIFDVRGRLVRTLLHEFRGEGLHKVIWDGRNDDGDIVASGTYFAELVAGTESVSEKMLLLR